MISVYIIFIVDLLHQFDSSCLCFSCFVTNYILNLHPIYLHEGQKKHKIRPKNLLNLIRASKIFKISYPKQPFFPIAWGNIRKYENTWLKKVQKKGDLAFIMIRIPLFSFYLYFRPQIETFSVDIIFKADYGEEKTKPNK